MSDGRPPSEEPPSEEPPQSVPPEQLDFYISPHGGSSGDAEEEEEEEGEEVEVDEEEEEEGGGGGEEVADTDNASDASIVEEENTLPLLEISELQSALAGALDAVQQFPPAQRDYFEQHLELLRACLEGGEPHMFLLAQLDLRQTMKHIKRLQQWPKEPIPIEDSAQPLQEVIYFEHAAEGLLRTKWANPLPMPKHQYSCDLCQFDNLQAGWQMVDVEGQRDRSEMKRENLGFDLCARCGNNYLGTLLRQLGRFVSEGNEAPLLHRSERYSAAFIRVEQTSVVRHPLGKQVEVLLQLAFLNSGEHLVGCLFQPEPRPASATTPSEYSQFPPSSAMATDSDSTTNPTASDCSTCSADSALIPAGEIHRLWREWSAAWEACHFCEVQQTAAAPLPTKEAAVDATCCFCMESIHEISEGKLTAVHVGCGHVFHQGCLRRFLREQRHGLFSDDEASGSAAVRRGRCPLCRHEIEFPRQPYQHLPEVHHTLSLVVPESCVGSSGQQLTALVLLVVDPRSILDSWTVCCRVPIPLVPL